MTELQIILIFALGFLFGACAALAWVNWELRRSQKRQRAFDAMIGEVVARRLWNEFLNRARERRSV